MWPTVQRIMAAGFPLTRQGRSIEEPSASPTQRLLAHGCAESSSKAASKASEELNFTRNSSKKLAMSRLRHRNPLILAALAALALGVFLCPTFVVAPRRVGAVLERVAQLPGEAHAAPEAAVLDFFNVTLEQGLSAAQVEQQFNAYGSNRLQEQEKKSLLELVAEQFDDLLVRILLLSAFVSFLLAYFNSDQKEEGLSAYIEPLVILMILVLNACVGVWQESNAEKALDSLKKLQSDSATVLRAVHWNQIDAVEMVPGDICEVKAGDKVPADIRLVKLKTTTVRAEQSQLTGAHKMSQNESK